MDQGHSFGVQLGGAKLGHRISAEAWGGTYPVFDIFAKIENMAIAERGFVPKIGAIGNTDITQAAGLVATIGPVSVLSDLQPVKANTRMSKPICFFAVKWLMHPKEMERPLEAFRIKCSIATNFFKILRKYGIPIKGISVILMRNRETC